MKVENVKKLEVTRKKYFKLRNTILCVLGFLIFLIVIINLYKYIMIKKIWKANLGVEFGDNYKITIDKDRDEIPDEYVYYKDGIKKIVNVNDNRSEIFITEDMEYCIDEYTKSYFTIEPQNGDKYCPQKMNMFLYNDLNVTKNMKTTLQSTIFDLAKSNVKLGKEILDGKEYIVFQQDNSKMYLNPTTYIAEIITKKHDNGSYYYVKMTVEPNVVTEKIELPNLEEYKNNTEH